MALRHLTKTIHHTVYDAISPSNPLNSAHEKTIIISGGAGGIGYGISQSFAAAGAAVIIIIARRQEALDEASTRLSAEIAATDGTTAVWTYLLDITKEPAVESIFDDIRKRLNEGNALGAQPRDADVLVTSAAHMSQGQTTLDYASQTYRDAIETNIHGNLNLTRAFLKPEIPAIPMAAMDGSVKKITPLRNPHHQKVILDIPTIATYIPLPGIATYSISKLAFTRAMQQLQTEVDALPGKPIRIHSFHPGTVLTPASASVLKQQQGIDLDDESLPGGFAVWLSSPAAAFLKGRFVFSNWDVEELIAFKGKYEEDPEFGTISLKIG
ncbi:NAD(P)-binding protein [Alternaria alternata]|nr:NAD(P)-binding protein [Alternaria alternata]